MARRGGFSFLGFESTTETTLLNQSALSCQHFTGSLILAEDGTVAAATAQRVGLHRWNALPSTRFQKTRRHRLVFAPSGIRLTIGPSRAGISGETDPPQRTQLASSRLPRVLTYLQGRRCGVGRGLGVALGGGGVGVPKGGVGVGVGVAVGVAVGVTVGVAVGVGVGVGVGEAPPTAAKISTRPQP